MTATSPRLDARLVAAAFVLDDRTESMAETWRRVGEVADLLGVPRPGYDTIRVLLHTSRQRRDEIRRLLEPVGADLVCGRLSPWDIERVRDAAAVARLDRRRRGR